MAVIKLKHPTYSLMVVSVSLLLLIYCHTAYSQPLNSVYYPAPRSVNDKRVEYPVQLLNLALSKVRTGYELRPSLLNITQSRALKLLMAGETVDVVWTMTSVERETQFLPIRIPIYKGLIGWRIFLIARDDQPLFNRVNRLEQLAKLTAGQGLDWPDMTIMRFNGLAVEGASTYEGLFDMLQRRRFIYFPRSVIEVWQELATHSQKGFVVENHILLHYPTALYYFVKKDNVQLAADIQTGLEAAIADGSFERLFIKFHQTSIERAKMSERKLFQLTNPDLPADTPLEQSHLWFNIAAEQ